MPVRVTVMTSEIIALLKKHKSFYPPYTAEFWSDLKALVDSRGMTKRRKCYSNNACRCADHVYEWYGSKHPRLVHSAVNHWGIEK